MADLDRRRVSIETRFRDARDREDLRERSTRDDGVDASDVAVIVSNGDVTLQGTSRATTTGAGGAAGGTSSTARDAGTQAASPS